MKTYADADVRKALAALVEQSSCRRTAAHLGVEQSGLNRMIRGEREINEKVARAAGFRLCERQWVRAA